VRLLLDTHTFLWFIGGHHALSQLARDLIEDTANQRWLSSASLWEIAIKLSLGKLSLAQPFDPLIPDQMQLNSIEILAIKVEHLAQVAKLPFHHRDPFDWLLIAQAMVEQMPIVSLDRAFDAYPIQRFW